MLDLKSGLGRTAEILCWSTKKYPKSAPPKLAQPCFQVLYSDWCSSTARPCAADEQRRVHAAHLFILRIQNLKTRHQRGPVPAN